MAIQRRRKIVDYLADALTSPGCPIEQNDWGHFGCVSIVYGTRDLFERFASRFDEWPEMKEEILISIITEP
jgi:hypothetical protein